MHEQLARYFRGTSRVGRETNEQVVVGVRRCRGRHGMLEVRDYPRIASVQRKGGSIVVCGETPFSCISGSF